MSEPAEGQTVAAVDLGSNSFHLVVAQLSPGHLKILDRLKEMVRLAGGLRSDGSLDPATRERALECLARFGQRLRYLPHERVRAVGTNTLRRARQAEDFLARAGTALGHPVEIVSGTEEARLVYLGVAHSLAVDPEGRRLVVDIGGGSTEVAVGEGYRPIRLESLYMGCVSHTRQYFPGGRITREAFQRAITAARLELEPLESEFRHLGWEEAAGSSGTVRAAASILEAAGWTEGEVTLQGLKKLRKVLVEAGHVKALADLKGLEKGRAPVFPGGLAILTAVCEALGIERMQASEGALREGLLHDLIGRIRHEDVREPSVAALARRYHVDAYQAGRVARTVRHLLHETAPGWGLDEEWAEAYLHWAAALHEIGLDIAHAGYHKHGAYVVANADLLGFSRQEQALLAALVRSHRRKLRADVFANLPDRWREPARRMAVLLRLAVLLHRNRSPVPLPAIGARTNQEGLRLEFPEGWLNEHPLTRGDLEQEAGLLASAELSLAFE